MNKKRQIVLVTKKMTFAEAEEQEIFQWQSISLEDKWKSLERLRKGFYSMHEKSFPQKLERVINIIRRGVSK